MIFIQENENFFDKTADIVVEVLNKLPDPFLNQYVYVFLPDKKSCRILKECIVKRYKKTLILPKFLVPLKDISVKSKIENISKTMSLLPRENRNFDLAASFIDEFRYIIDEQISLNEVEKFLINKNVVDILKNMQIFSDFDEKYIDHVKNSEFPSVIAGFRRSNKYIEDFINAAFQNKKNRIIFYHSADIYEFQKRMVYNVSGRYFDKKQVDTEANVYLTNLPGMYEEIKLIASIVRQNIGKKISLLYTNKSIIRGVQLYLKKWNIILDGAPCQTLKETKEGVIILLILKLFKGDFKLKDVLSLVKFVTKGESCKLERDIFLSTKIAIDVSDFVNFDLESATPIGKEIIQHLMQIFQIVNDGNGLDFYTIFEKTVKFVLSFIECDKCCDDFWENLHEFVDKTESRDEFFAIVEKLLDLYIVQHETDYTPNISALSPQESLLINSDITIICGFSESNWSVNKKSFLFNTLCENAPQINERENDIIYDSINHALKTSDEVYITNSDPLGYCQILNSFLTADEIKKSLKDGSVLAFCDEIFKRLSIKPNPAPALEFRPLSYSATDIENLSNNPYSFYAKKILKLRPIVYIFDDNYKNRLKGIILHEALKLANCQNKAVMQDNISYFVNLEMEKFKLEKFHFLDWRFRIPQIAKFASKNIEYAQYLEYTGEVKFCLSDNFHVNLKCIADCIKNTESSIIISDYKTGTLPSMQQIISLEKPQLVVEGIIAQKSGFFGLENLPIEDLKLIQLGGAEKSMNIMSISEKLKTTDINDLLKELEKRLTELLAKYTIEVNGYQATCGKFYDEYGHLARGKEWGTYA